MAKGTYWIYRGTVSWQTGATVSQTTVEWKMEVVETIVRDGIATAVLKGHPGDLAWYTPGKARGDYRLIRVDGKRYYLVPERASRLEPLREADDSTLFLELPLRVGARFGDASQFDREDGMYCWRVGEQRPLASSGIKGLPKGAGLMEYVLAYSTNPDHQIVGFAPGVGITSYVYGHHGTVSRADVQLVEFHAPSQ